MLVHKDKITFRECNKKMKHPEYRQNNRQNKGYKKLRDDIKEKGIINPLLCIEENGIYKICLGLRRFLVGEELNQEWFKIKVVPNDSIELLKKEKELYKPTEAH